MPLEAGVLKSQEKEREEQEKTEKEQTFDKIRKIDFQMGKEKNTIYEQTEDLLDKLRRFLDEGILDINTSQLVEKVTESKYISSETLQEVFEKIDEIQNNESMNKYLPEEARITQDEYKKALTDHFFRIRTISKINTALWIIAEHTNPNSSLGLNLFSGFIAVLDKNLVTLQESHIDIKNSLIKIEFKTDSNIQDKIENYKSLSIWQRILQFIKKLFS